MKSLLAKLRLLKTGTGGPSRPSPGRDKMLGGLLGFCVGDAMGVPVEGAHRTKLAEDPVTGMRGFGSHNQPPGTWSDDTSMMLSVADSLGLSGFFNYRDMIERFRGWAREGRYTAHGSLFDIGATTREALARFEDGCEPLSCGGATEADNGNGSLMRMLPLAYWLAASGETRFAKPAEACAAAHAASSLTHAHAVSKIACGLYAAFAGWLLSGPKGAAERLQAARGYYESKRQYRKELARFGRIFRKDFARLPESEIRSGTYVVESLEAALWCFLGSGSYRECVLKAVNLGGNTDTVAALAGGLAGTRWGLGGIPKEWLSQIARLESVTEIFERFCDSLECDRQKTGERNDCQPGNQTGKP